MSVFPLLIHRNSTRSFDESWHSSEKNPTLQSKLNSNISCEQNILAQTMLLARSPGVIWVCCSGMVMVMVVQWQSVRSIISPSPAPYLPTYHPPPPPSPRHPPLSLLSSLSPSNQFQHLLQNCTERRGCYFLLKKFNLFTDVGNNKRSGGGLTAPAKYHLCADINKSEAPGRCRIFNIVLVTFSLLLSSAL